MRTRYVMLETVKVSFTTATEITGTLALEKEIFYWGMLNADGTIDATKEFGNPWTPRLAR